MVAGKMDISIDNDNPIGPIVPIEPTGGYSILGSINGIINIQDWDTAGSMPIPVNITQKDSCYSEYYYTYDNAGRLNSAGIPASLFDNNSVGQKMEYFDYDPLDRLTTNRRMQVVMKPFQIYGYTFNLPVMQEDTLSHLVYSFIQTYQM